MKPVWLAAALCAAPASARTAALYSEPASGPRLTVVNQKNRKRLFGTDWYCVREIRVDGAAVFGGDRCRIKHGETKTLRLAPGRRRVDFDTVPDWGAEGDPGVPPPILLTATVDAGDKDLTVLLRDADPPAVFATAVPEAAPSAAPAASTTTASTPPVQPPAASTAAAAPDPFKSLERLKDLYDKGVITEDEFKAKKAELLKSIH